ncbi:MAG TPA: UDP-N-acetylmuramoyl-L-alanyl-D-glutamate--2,6-diaminopimelate ligase [Armatimonadota bacterium]|nr:UDP-N-acetylmuramoyl-L-alanyl-D-glutamate--2,6-diaminopimelate ligase [Armatimonadota bacterium]
MTRLADLQAVVPGARLIPAAEGQPEREITGLAYDSRAVKPGDLFFCVRGLKSDGHRFLPDAIARGAAAAVVERDDLPLPIPALHVPNGRAAMPELAAAFHGYPSRRLSLVGVTGTNGKTTTTYLVAAIARAAGRDTGVIGTIGARINEEALPGERTTPESPDLQALLARMAEGVERRVVAMEVSSHALDLGRTLGCEFDTGVFTNLTQDHLDYHATMEEYFQAKAKLFTEYPRASEKPFTGVINTDDPYGRRLVEMCAGRALSYGIEQEAELRVRDVQASPKGLAFTLRAPEGEFPVELRLGGLFNVYNSLAAMGAARALGFPWETILPALAASPGVPGRFESVDAGQDFSVIVDYAHSPDGVENVLRAARALRPRRLITVFGCGGDRDRTKRPIMGRLAAELSDRVVVTSDNPRTEEPDAIIREILTGIPPASAARVETEPDRAAAIRHAVALAQTGDLVVIAGKGHEDYQIFADRTIHFDDREEARKALHARLSA